MMTVLRWSNCFIKPMLCMLQLGERNAQQATIRQNLRVS
jgi:hypothetical protein